LRQYARSKTAYAEIAVSPPANREEFSKTGWPKKAKKRQKPSRLLFPSSAFFGNNLRGLDLIAAAPR
jgi:hypothetical protein